MKRRKIAREVTIDTGDFAIKIDGVEFPFYVREVPSIDPASDDYPLNIVTLEVLAENVHIVWDDSATVYDSRGERSEWAKACVNRIVEERLSDTLAWLRGAGVDV